MTRNHKENGNVRMELKYCEHCGGLWVREGGGGAYCEKCEEKVAGQAFRLGHPQVPVLHGRDPVSPGTRRGQGGTGLKGPHQPAFP